MKGQIQINMADDSGILVQASFQYEDRAKSYTIPAGEQQLPALGEILRIMRKQVKIEEEQV